ncbi:sensor histidine kinase [Gemmiger sp.]
MAKRKLTSLRTVLLRYLLLCGGGCALILVLWWVIFMQLINIGFLLPAVASAQACAEAREAVAAVTAETFDSNQISDLCRWAVVQNDTVLQTNMTARQLKIALNAFHGGSGNLGYTQYQYDVKMADGSFCLLQYDYATPYADPALRDTLPDFQTCYMLLLALLVIAWLGWQTHRTVRVFAAETAHLHRAVDAIAAQQPERIDADGARLREFSATLQAMQTMGRELTDSLQSQWRMEQQRAEQIAALTHDLKTPLSIIQGNADLLAEDALSADQRTQVEAILRGTDRAQQYLAALRTACAPPAAGETFPSHPLVSTLAETARALCAPAGVQFVLDEQWQGTLCAAQCDLLRAGENLLDNAVRYTPRGGTVTLLVTKEKQDFILRVTDTGPGFTAEALARAGELLYTEAARSDTAHQGFGLYFARRVALSHSGTLRLSNTPGGCAELCLPICEQIEK